jgi:hypothetical protein
MIRSTSAPLVDDNSQTDCQRPAAVSAGLSAVVGTMAYPNEEEAGMLQSHRVPMPALIGEAVHDSLLGSG